jgi:hypothetical protein
MSYPITPALTEHPNTRCIECGRDLEWVVLADLSDVAYVDDQGATGCEDSFPHEPISGANDGVLYAAELDAYRAAVYAYMAGE